MRNGFTLSEILITLGIIGVVSAMTIPVLIQKYNNNVAETRLKKFYSVMNQAVMFAKNDYGDFPWEDYHVMEQKDENGDAITDENGNRLDQNNKIDIVYKKYLAPYLNIINSKEIKDAEKNKRIVHFFSDGSAFAYDSSQNRDIEFFPSKAERCLTFVKEERTGTCSFEFYFDPSLATKDVETGVEPYKFSWNGKIDRLYKGCEDNSSYERYYCTAIIQLNGWKIPGDYPKRIK